MNNTEELLWKPLNLGHSPTIESGIQERIAAAQRLVGIASKEAWKKENLIFLIHTRFSYRFFEKVMTLEDIRNERLARQ